MKKGKMIVFEGVDGVGKSTQIKMSEKWLKEIGEEPVVLTPFSDDDGSKEKALKYSYLPFSKAMIHLATRYELLAHRIWGNIHSGKIVLMDRYNLSTIVYQCDKLSSYVRPEVESVVIAVDRESPQYKQIVFDSNVEEVLKRQFVRGDISLDEKYDLLRRMVVYREYGLPHATTTIIDSTPPAHVVFESVKSVITKALKGE